MTEEEQVTEGQELPEQENVDPALWLQLQQANQRFHASQSEYDSANEVAKAAKKRMEAMQEALNGVVDSIVAAGTELPLFQNDEPDAHNWRAVSIQALVLSPKVDACLRENEPPLETVGALSDWMNAKGDFWAKDLNGIGDAARKEIEDALEAFWATQEEAGTDEEVAEQDAP